MDHVLLMTYLNDCTFNIKALFCVLPNSFVVFQQHHGQSCARPPTTA